MKIKSPSHLGKRLLLLGSCTAVLAMWNILQWPCLPRTLTGVPCVLCGMTRAWLAAFRLDLAAAFFHHPMFWCVPLYVIFLLWDGKPFKRGNGIILSLLTAALVLCHAIRLVAYLKGDIVL